MSRQHRQGTRACPCRTHPDPWPRRPARIIDVTQERNSMPIFNKPTGPAAVWEPPEASARLAATAGANPSGVFTSDLSVAEYALLCEAGCEPLGFVVGSTIYHIGMQQASWTQNTELEVLTQAMYNARELAMSRMRNEA